MAESGGGGQEISENIQQPVGQWRFDKMMELSRAVVFRKPEVVGIENLGEIPSNAPLIIVTSHLSDTDIPTIESELRPRLKAIRPNRGIGVSLQSNNLVDPRTAPFINFAGRKHFFEYDVNFDKSANHLRFIFNPENFRKMKEALHRGTDIITAAHEPLSNIPGSAWELPEQSGLGAAYLAQMANAVVLPVALDIQTDKPVGMSADVRGTVRRLLKRQRPNTRMIIGKPFTLDKINDSHLEQFGKYASSISKLEGASLEQLSPDEKANAKMILKRLREQSNLIMRRVADLLPEEKKGRWKSSSANDTTVS